MRMRFLASIIGAIVGAVVGVASVVFIAFLMMGNNELGVGFMVAVFGWVGLLIGAVGGVVLALVVDRYLRRNDLGEDAHRKKVLLVASLILGIPCLVTGMLWRPFNSNNMPPDKELLANFQHHQETFDQLAQMVQQDQSLKRVGDNWTDPDDPQSIGVTPARIAQYRQLFDLAGIHSGFEAFQGPQEVKFLYWGRGSAVSSDTDKGYAYLEKPPAQTLTSLDQCQPDFKNGSLYYRHIQGNWYLYYDYVPD